MRNNPESEYDDVPVESAGEEWADDTPNDLTFDDPEAASAAEESA